MTFFQKIVFNNVITWMINELAVIEKKDPDVAEFRSNLYKKSIPDFLDYAVQKLSKQNLSNITTIEYLKKVLDSTIDPKVDSIIDSVLDELNPDKKDDNI